MLDRVAGETPIPTNVANAVRLLAHRVRVHRHELELNVQLRQAYRHPVPALDAKVVALDLGERNHQWQRVVDSERALIAMRKAIEESRQALDQAIEDAAIGGQL
jgi:hypothetical protein